MSIANRATEVFRDERYGWGIEIQGPSFECFKSCVPGIESEDSAKGYMLGWNNCMRAIGRGMLLKAVGEDSGCF